MMTAATSSTYRRHARSVTGARLALVAWTSTLAGCFTLVASGAWALPPTQVERGRTVYAERCAACHHEELLGRGDALPLTGKAFETGWSRRSTRELFEVIRTTMPLAAGNSLEEAAYLAVTAYILAFNGATTGAAPLVSTTDLPIGSVIRAERRTPGAPAAVGAAAVTPPAGVAPAASASVGVATPPSKASAAVAPGLTLRGDVRGYADVTDDVLRNPSPHDWLMYRGNYAGWSHSALDQITTENVDRLQLVWSWAMRESGTSQATPLVRDGVLFLLNPGHVVQALNAATGELLWEHQLGPPPRRSFGAGMDANRSMALYGNKVFVSTHEAGHSAKLIALDARTGSRVWEADIGDPTVPFGRNTGGLIVANGKVLSGLTDCGDRPVKRHCYISAYDAESGRRVWKFRTIALEGEPGGDTWGGLPNDQRAGGETWIAGTFDPKSNTTFWGVAQAKPWRRDLRGSGDGETLYANTTLALDADTGALKWYFNHAPGETLDLDEVFERILIDEPDQEFLLTIGKPGILWKLDRRSGRFIAAQQTVLNNVSTVDPKTGRVTLRDDILTQQTDQWLSSCPGPQGGHNWHAATHHPASRLVVIPLAQSCVLMLGNGSQKLFYAPGTDGKLGRLAAHDVRSLAPVWTVEQRSPFTSAALSTAGDVLFVGDFDRTFAARDVRTGKKLWETRLGTTVQGHPITFSVGGRQFVAVTTGLGGGSPQQKPMTLLPEVHRPLTGNQIYVFALPPVETNSP